jgi:hypothetical protein
MSISTEKLLQNCIEYITNQARWEQPHKANVYRQFADGEINSYEVSGGNFSDAIEFGEGMADHNTGVTARQFLERNGILQK